MDAASDLRREVVDGLLYAHSRLNTNTGKTMEAASFLYALIELLTEKGVITVAELDERKRAVGQRLADQLRRGGDGVILQNPEYDKYTFQGAEIDCAGRIALCKAACCRLPFALSKQDIREGLVRWDLGQPYMIAQDADGYCAHLDRSACACTVREHRPTPCRGFDCRQDKRIWADFERREINPQILDPDWPRAQAEAMSHAGSEGAAG